MTTRAEEEEPRAQDGASDPHVWQLPTGALVRLAAVLATFVGLTAVPYLDERLADYRYLDLIDPGPLVRAATLQQPLHASPALGVDPSAVATMPGEALALDSLPGESALLAAAATMGDGVAPLEVAPAEALAGVKPVALAGEGTTVVVGAATPATQDGAAGVVPASLLVPIEALEGQTVWLEGAAGTLDSFYTAVSDLAHGRRELVRIAHYGDSHIANDGITHTIRVLLQRRFGDGGHGHVLGRSRTRWYRHKGVVRQASEGWVVRNFLGGSLSDGAYGHAGVAATGGAGQWLQVGTTKSGPGSVASRFSLSYRAQGRAVVDVIVDGKLHESVVVAAGSGDGVMTVVLADGLHRVRWRLRRGRLRVFGAVVERSQGLVYDSLGVVGARASRWSHASKVHMDAQRAGRRIDLIVMNYGGNARGDKVSGQRYRTRFREALDVLRGESVAAGNRPACLVLGPGDHGKRHRGRVISDPRTLRLIDWQRQVAREAGCAFFDVRAWMGGDGSMGRWVKAGLGWADYAHLTPRGDQQTGKAVYRALLGGMRDWLATQP